MISGYRFLHDLGQGGFSTVYLAEQEIFERRVAVKVMHSDLRDPDARRRFVRECRATGRLTGNPHIITVFDAGTTTDHRPYIAMEYLPAGTLRDRVNKIGPLPVREMVTLALPVAQALDAAHQQGILHRDLKPANILLRGPEHPVLSDFGIASIAEGREAVTVSAAFTAGFAAPEVILGEQPERSSDVFGLGATLFALLTQATPFPGRTPTEIYHRIVSGDMAPFGRADVPPALEDLLRAMLAPEPDHRPLLGEVSTGLGAVLTAVGGEAGPPAGLSRDPLWREPPARDEAPTAAGPGSEPGQRAGAGVGHRFTGRPPGPVPPDTRPDPTSGRRLATAVAGTAALLTALVAAVWLLTPRSGGADDALGAGQAGGPRTSTPGPVTVSPQPPAVTPPGTAPIPTSSGSGSASPTTTAAASAPVCTPQRTRKTDYQRRTFTRLYMCATSVGSEVYANIAAAAPDSPDDSGYMDRDSQVWVICQVEGRANPDLGGRQNTWWLYTKGDRPTRNAFGYQDSWGYLPATAVASAPDGEPVPDVARCPGLY
ncbi:serine/threonine-protein kinase [Parafrankia elaeagni]|uniref:serine/threonine-protein kinase n=1 Tax=Parafrankia elaeagni TaxID=222534 RepID=UPI00035C47DC|nr:serine/threonine-protein kinase [Parafrankia elaeagni]